MKKLLLAFTFLAALAITLFIPSCGQGINGQSGASITLQMKAV